jgi:autotransporter strand-loop-strand O-heptosyltransferase
MKADKAYLLYANERYLDIISMCAKSIREFSELPIIVYLLNSDMKVDIENTTTINWKCDVSEVSNDMYHPSDENFYINRGHENIYRLLIQRPAVTLDALNNYADTVVYLDSDIIVTPYIDSVFDMYNVNTKHPYLTAGVYDYLFINGRGSSTDMNSTLEYPLCNLLDVDQSVRSVYRTTNIYIASQASIPFIEEWNATCNLPIVLSNHNLYAPFHEETIINVLLWKYNFLNGLPYVYVNGGLEEMNDIDELGFTGQENPVRDWFTIPAKKEHLLAFHGEKRIDKMQQMINRLKTKPMRVLFLAPHLSTGGMPAFLLKRIELLQKYTDTKVYVVEYQNYSDEYVVQKNKIEKLCNLFTLLDDKMKLIDIIKNNNIDVVHIDEMIEGFDGYNTVPEELMKALYAPDRTWRIIETCHNVWFNPDQNKRYHPDAYAFCTPYHLETFANMPSPKYVLEFPIADRRGDYNWQDAFVELGFDGSKEHVVNVGLWTQGKNQKEAVEIARRMPDVQFHFVGNQAVNFKDYWEPIMAELPPNCKIWGERDDAWKFMLASDVFIFNSTWECNPLVVREAISYGCKILARNLPQYCGMFDGYITPIDENNLKAQLTEALDGYIDYEIPMFQEEEFAKLHDEMYRAVYKAAPYKQPITIIYNNVGQPFLEIKGALESIFNVRFYDESGELHYQNNIGCNNWVRLHRSYYTKWYVRVKENDEVVVYKNSLDYTGKRVYIAFDSSSLGDSIAWMPYVLEFKKKHNCHVIVSTFRNELFQDVYPELEFVNPGTIVNNIDGMYTLGWFYDESKEPELPNTIPLQKAATNILGLEYEEIVPRIAFTPKKRPYKKYITIATNSTSGCKFWTRESWQELINHYHNEGYKIVNVSLEDNPFDNCIVPEDKSIENTMNLIYYSKFFVGLSSGLSWLAWALKKDVVMISNFTQKDHEFKCIRVTNTSVCHGCWNDPQYKFDKGDWNWCPVNKGTDKQFECQTSITSQMVIDKINSEMEEVIVPDSQSS